MTTVRLFLPVLFALFLPMSTLAQSIDGLQVDEDGKVGIGTSSPESLLEVAGGKVNFGTGSLPVWAHVGVTGRQNAKMYLGTKNPSKYDGSVISLNDGRTGQSLNIGMQNLGNSESLGSIKQWKGGYWHDHIRFTSGLTVHFQKRKHVNSPYSFGGVKFHVESVFHENVGIGTSSPSSSLEVNGTVSATTIQETSARRFKTNIEPIEKASALVQALQGVRFQWKENGASDLGFVAEEVKEVLPSLVSHTEDGRADGLSYSHLTAVLVEALKEQTQRVDAHSNDVEAQRARSEQQQSQINRLQTENEALREKIAAQQEQIDKLRRQVRALTNDETETAE